MQFCIISQVRREIILFSCLMEVDENEDSLVQSEVHKREDTESQIDQDDETLHLTSFNFQTYEIEDFPNVSQKVSFDEDGDLDIPRRKKRKGVLILSPF